MANDNWRDRVSQPTYGMRVDRDVFVTTRDDTRLACDVYRPDAPGKFPALLSYSLYGKDIQKVTKDVLPLSPLRGNGRQEAGDTEYFVSRGYVHVVADVRGSGDSEGGYCFQGTKEQEGPSDPRATRDGAPEAHEKRGRLLKNWIDEILELPPAQRPSRTVGAGLRARPAHARVRPHRGAVGAAGVRGKPGWLRETGIRGMANLLRRTRSSCLKLGTR